MSIVGMTVLHICSLLMSFWIDAPSRQGQNYQNYPPEHIKSLNLADVEAISVLCSRVFVIRERFPPFSTWRKRPLNLNMYERLGSDAYGVRTKGGHVYNWLHLNSSVIGEGHLLIDCVVNDMAFGGPAYNSGVLKRGDIILRVDGNIVISYSS